jgi:hypothetical protein
MMKHLTQGGGALRLLAGAVFSLAIFVCANWTADQAWADAIGTSQLRISVGTSTVTLNDDNGDGIINFNGSIGGFLLVVSTGVSRPAIGSASAPYLDLNSIQVTGGSAPSVITIAYTDTSFTELSAGLNSYTSMIGGSCGNCSGTFNTYLDSSNAAFGTGTSLGQTTFGPGSFSDTFTSDNLPTSYPYSLTEVVSITMPGNYQSSSFNAELQATPEPGSLVLLGSGMAGLGLIAWRRSKKPQPTA